MPLEIVRNDITKMKADAIVNTANPEVRIGAGVDSAIYKAAGRLRLFHARAKIGRMVPGQAAATPAFRLDAKYIIHTVGPVWQGGDHGESETVAECYRNSLSLAHELEAESIAFPLISTGTLGFPKDLALSVAIKEIGAFLMQHDMTVYLVVYNKEAFELSGKLFENVKSYIEESDVVVREPAYGNESRMHHLIQLGRELGGAPGSRNAAPSLDGMFAPLENAPEEMQESVPELYPDEAPCMGRIPEEGEGLGGAPEEDMMVDVPEDAMEIGGAPEDNIGFDRAPLEEGEGLGAPEERTIMGDLGPIESSKAEPIDEFLKKRSETFQQRLFRIIDRKDLSDAEVYKKANLDRKLFSKIRSNEDYNPSKRTALALAIALELNLDETKDLIGRAGHALSPSSIFDMIIEYCINNGEYDINQINCVLFDWDQPTLGGAI